MATDSSNSNDLPVRVTRRNGTAESDAASPNEEIGQAAPGGWGKGQVTYYSAESEIRQPLVMLGNIVRDMVHGRELAWRLFFRNLRGMYRQTLLGLFWAFLPPLVNTAFWVFLREAGVFKPSGMEVNSTIYILAGMIYWQAFIDAFQMPLAMLNKNKNMISKLNFPREALLLVGIGEVAFDCLIRSLLLIPAFWFFGVPIHASLCLVPVVVVCLMLLGAGLGLLILPIGSLYQDVGRFVGMALPFWMILTPVIYPPLETMPGSLLNWVNPASPLLLVARDWTLLGSTGFGMLGWIFGLASLPLLVLGLVVYRVSIPVLIERMTA